MVEILSHNLETMEPPSEFTVDTVQYYCKHTKQLEKSQVSKALKFVKYDCVRYVGQELLPALEKLRLMDAYKDGKNFFVCLPLNKKEVHNFLGFHIAKLPYEKDYNSSEYIIYRKRDGMFCCNCQGWVSKEQRGELQLDGVMCSHVLALFYCFKMKRFSQGGKDEVS